MHELERQALGDPFLSDALEGYAYADNSVSSQLSILQRRLELRIAAKHENKNLLNFTWQRLSIAAAAGLMFISASILFWMNTNKADKLPASGTKKANVELSPDFKKNKRAIKDSEMPAAGWKNYNNYLKKNVKYPPKALAHSGIVIVGFSVDNNGSLDTFKIIKSLDRFCDAEAIRLIKKGPPWNPSAQAPSYRATVNVSFERPQ